VASIRQDLAPDVLPDFRNLGVLARVLVGVNVLAFAMALGGAADLRQAPLRFVQSAWLVEPLLLLSLIVLAAAAPLLARAPYWAGVAAVLASSPCSRLPRMSP